MRGSCTGGDCTSRMAENWLMGPLGKGAFDRVEYLMVLEEGEIDARVVHPVVLK